MPSPHTSTSAPAQRKYSITALAPIARKHNSLMKTKILLATLLALALWTAGYAQTLDPSSVAVLRRVDKAKLDQFFDRLAEKLRRSLFQPRRARESYDYQRRRNAFLSTAGRVIGGSPRSDGRG